MDEIDINLIEKGLDAAADILWAAGSDIWEAGTPDEALKIAEVARIKADNAYRKAIGATCEDCGGNTEQHIGNS